MRLLITGGGGLLGSRLCEFSVARNYQTYAVYTKHKPLHGIPLKVNITNNALIKKTIEELKPDAVVHAAALTDVDKCELQQDKAWKVNVEGTRAIAESCKKENIFLVYISTDYIFHGKKGNYRENDAPNPINYYGLTKLKGEQVIKDLLTDYCIARASVLYGSYPAAGKTNFALWVLEKLKKAEKIKVVADQWNSPTLNSSLANMTLEIINRKQNGIYHLSGSTRISRFEFAKLIARTFELDEKMIRNSSLKDFQWPAKRPKDSSLNVEKAKKNLINKPLEIEQALEAFKREIEH